MKTKITIGAALLLTLGSAVGGGLAYQKDRALADQSFAPAVISQTASELTPAMIDKMKATAATSDYSPAMRPI